MCPIVFYFYFSRHKFFETLSNGSLALDIFYVDNVLLVENENLELVESIFS